MTNPRIWVVLIGGFVAALPEATPSLALLGLRLGPEEAGLGGVMVERIE